MALSLARPMRSSGWVLAPVSARSMAPATAQAMVRLPALEPAALPTMGTMLMAITVLPLALSAACHIRLALHPAAWAMDMERQALHVEPPSTRLETSAVARLEWPVQRDRWDMVLEAILAPALLLWVVASQEDQQAAFLEVLAGLRPSLPRQLDSRWAMVAAFLEVLVHPSHPMGPRRQTRSLQAAVWRSYLPTRL